MPQHTCFGGPTPLCPSCRAEGPVPALQRVLEVQRHGETFGLRPALRTQTQANAWVRWETEARRQERQTQTPLEGFSGAGVAVAGLGLAGALAAYLLWRSRN